MNMSYVERALARAKRRKSAWNLLVFAASFPSWLALYFLIIQGIDLLHQQVHPGQSLATAKGLPVLLSTLPLLLGTLPVGFAVGNLLVWLVPPARRVLDAEARPHLGTDFFSSQRNILKFAAVAAPSTLVLAVIGAVLPW